MVGPAHSSVPNYPPSSVAKGCRNVHAAVCRLGQPEFGFVVKRDLMLYVFQSMSTQILSLVFSVCFKRASKCRMLRLQGLGTGMLLT